MFQYLRSAAFGVAALAFVAGFSTDAAKAAPIISNSGNLSMELLLSTSTNVEIIAEGADGFRIQGIGGAPLTTTGGNVTIDLFVAALNGTKIDGWLASLFGDPGGSMGEDIFDGTLTSGLGNNSVATGDTLVFFFGPQDSLYIIKDIGANGPQIDYVIQALAVPVPEPASLLVLGMGIAGLAALRRHRRRAQG